MLKAKVQTPAFNASVESQGGAATFICDGTLAIYKGTNNDSAELPCLSLRHRPSLES